MDDKWLIDANALLDKANYYQCAECGTECYEEVVTVHDIYEAPTIDAVEVVRCKECKFAEQTIWSSGEMYCLVWKMNPRPNGYCYLGVKMDDK